MQVSFALPHQRKPFSPGISWRFASNAQLHERTRVVGAEDLSIKVYAERTILQNFCAPYKKRLSLWEYRTRFSFDKTKEKWVLEKHVYLTSIEPTPDFMTSRLKNGVYINGHLRFFAASFNRSGRVFRL